MFTRQPLTASSSGGCRLYSADNAVNKSVQCISKDFMLKKLVGSICGPCYCSECHYFRSTLLFELPFGERRRRRRGTAWKQFQREWLFQAFSFFCFHSASCDKRDCYWIYIHRKVTQKSFDSLHNIEHFLISHGGVLFRSYSEIAAVSGLASIDFHSQ